MSNIEKLNGIKELLLMYARGSNDREALEIFEKEDIGKINKKFFYHALYFLTKLINPNHIKKLTWPLTKKNNYDSFLVQFLKVINDVKIQYPWAEIPHFQKSHFRDPRPENDKAVKFLSNLTTLTAHILSGIRPSEKSLDELGRNHEEIKEMREEREKELESIKAQQLAFEMKIKNQSSTLTKIKLELLDEGVISSPEDFTMNILLKEKEKLERQLLNAVVELDKLTDEHFD